MIIYELVSEDLTHLGGRMGTEYTTENWHYLFETIGAAKAYAEKDYRYQKETPIQWYHSIGSHYDCSGDLHYVMYTIKPVKMKG